MTKQEFEEMVYFKLLGKDEMLVMEFISYWTETDLKGKKMRFQGEKYFDVIRRFSTFEKNKAIEKTIQAQELLNEWTNGNNKTNRLD